MPHYSLLSSAPTSEEWIPSYVEAVAPMVAKHGGKYLARTTNYERMEGTPSRFCEPSLPHRRQR